MSEPLRSLERGIKWGFWKCLALLFSTPPKKVETPLASGSVRSVLVVRPDRLGDVILSTPVYESIKNAFPDAKLTVLVDRAFAEVLKDNPFIDCVFEFDRRRPFKILAKLFGAPFDLALTLNKNFSATASFLTLCSRAKLRVGYAHSQNAWVHHFRVAAAVKPQHEIENNLDLLRALGFDRIASSPRIFFNRNEELKIEGLLKNNRRFPNRPLILIKPGTRVVKWGWALEKFGALADTLQKSEKAEVFFIAGPGEQQMIDSLMQRMEEKPFCLPPLSIKEFAYAISKSDVLVANHTGIMHLASAVQTPVLAIFKHGDLIRWGPTHTPHLILEERNGSSLEPDAVREGIRKLLLETKAEPRAQNAEHP